MSPIQQMLLGVGAVAEKTYVDDVFSTFIYDGTGSPNKTITNGLDLSTEGGMVWCKMRDGNFDYRVFDTEQGTGKYLRPNEDEDQETDANSLTAFNTTGFTLGSSGAANMNGQNYVSWSFRKAKGFFTVKEYSGTGSPQSVSHDLGSQPGMILIKRTDTSADWVVYHRHGDIMAEQGGTSSSTERGYWKLNESHSVSYTSRLGDRTSSPTATTFDVKNQSDVNASGGTYVAYIFAGGESTAATARSVDFDPSYPADYLTIPSSSDVAYGTGDFTWEAFIKFEATDTGYIINHGGTGHYGGIYISGTTITYKNASGSNAATIPAPKSQWNHIAVARSSGTTRVFVNGILGKTKTSDTYNYSNRGVSIGAHGDGSFAFTGKISNVRLVKGTALYTSSFRPPTEPLTNVTNTVLLCCNNSSTTGSTVTPGTITANGSPTASTDSPFDDPAGFQFGNAGEGIVKCGSFKTDGNGAATVNIGWEPSFLIMKRADGGAGWYTFDSVREFPVDGNSDRLQLNDKDGSQYMSNYNVVSSSGFSVNSINTNSTHIFIAVRRPDGYVGKPLELGTGAFAMDYGSGSSTIPNFDSNFPVDFALLKRPTATSNFLACSRSSGDNYLFTNSTQAEVSHSNFIHWDSNAGWAKNWDNQRFSWMFKRHAGFDVVAYDGNSVSGTQIAHSLNKTPEMIWVKRRNDTKDWQVGHHGANGGTNPWNYYLELNNNQTENSQVGIWNNTAPTSTHFTVGNWTQVNNSSGTYLAMLFASVDGVSKVGYYAGSNSSQTITTGFQPRFLIIKLIDDSGGDWIVFDTTRGWGSGNDNYIRLNENHPQASYNFGAPTSTGFTLVGNTTGINMSPYNFIYYAHA